MKPALLLYNLLLHAAITAAAPGLLPLALLSPKRRSTAGHRLALTPSPRLPRSGRPLWVHALSVGEVLSALPLVEALGAARPRRLLFFSAATLTGRRIADARLAGRVDALGYFPYDLPATVALRLRQVRPAAVVLVETDLWPNFLFQAAAAHIPVILVNARLSRRSYEGYRRLRPLAVPLLATLAAVAVQTPRDAERFGRLGVPARRLVVTGSLKFDQAEEADPEAAAAMRRRLQVAPEHPVVVAGSTHPGDEGPLLAALDGWRRRFAHFVLVLAPRDPARAGEILRAWRRRGGDGCRWSALDDGRRRGPLVVVDRMGELRRLYGAGDVAFVGGSLDGCGGHNPLEPAAWGRPVLFGPDMSDFALIAEQLTAAGGALPVADGAALARGVERLLAQPAKAREMGTRARSVLHAHRGAVGRTAALVERVLAGGPPGGR